MTVALAQVVGCAGITVVAGFEALDWIVNTALCGIAQIKGAIITVVTDGVLTLAGPALTSRSLRTAIAVLANNSILQDCGLTQSAFLQANGGRALRTVAGRHTATNHRVGVDFAAKEHLALVTKEGAVAEVVILKLNTVSIFLTFAANFFALTCAVRTKVVFGAAITVVTVAPRRGGGRATF